MDGEGGGEKCFGCWVERNVYRRSHLCEITLRENSVGDDPLYKSGYSHSKYDFLCTHIHIHIHTHRIKLSFDIFKWSTIRKNLLTYRHIMANMLY